MAATSCYTHGQQSEADKSLSLTLGVLQERWQECIAKRDFKAMESLTRTMTTLAPGWADAHYNLACALALQGKKDEALNWSGYPCWRRCSRPFCCG